MHKQHILTKKRVFLLTFGWTGIVRGPHSSLYNVQVCMRVCIFQRICQRVSFWVAQVALSLRWFSQFTLPRYRASLMDGDGLWLMCWPLELSRLTAFAKTANKSSTDKRLQCPSEGERWLGGITSSVSRWSYSAICWEAVKRLMLSMVVTVMRALVYDAPHWFMPIISKLGLYFLDLGNTMAHLLSS